MLQNDPLLVFLVQRLHLTPFEIALASLIVLPGVLLFWCWGSGTMRVRSTMANPEGHGFWSSINLYLIVVPILNFAIFEYYDVYNRTIRELCADHILQDSADYIFGILATRSAKAATVVSFSISFALALNSLLWNKYFHKPRITNWLCRLGTPRPIAFYFQIQFFFVELAIIFNWVLRNILLWWRLNASLRHANIQPFSPDRMFGLGAVSVLAQWSFLVISLISLLVVLWILGARITLKKRSLYSNPAYLSAALAIVMFGPAAVILPLRSAHVVMYQARTEQLSKLSDRIQEISKNILQQVNSGSSNESQLSALMKRLEAGNRLYDFVKNSSTWPISASILSSFPIGFLSPVLVPLIVEVGKKYMSGTFGGRASSRSG